MEHPTVTAVVGTCLLLFVPLGAIGQELPTSWIPFTAKQVQTYALDLPSGGPRGAELIGLYVRDSHGRSYNRLRVTSSPGSLPAYGMTDTATLFDRPSQKFFQIDFVRKTFRIQDPDPSNRSTEPLSREQFDKAHAGEKFLGKQVISGVECEGFQVPTPHFKNHFNETCYAPALNFMVIRATGYNPRKQRFEIRLEDIQAGREPDPSLFRLPDGFKEAKD